MPNKKYLLKYLTPLAIAYWFMDDGSLKVIVQVIIYVQIILN